MARDEQDENVAFTQLMFDFWIHVVAAPHETVDPDVDRAVLAAGRRWPVTNESH